MTTDKTNGREEMVGWYDFKQLLNTGIMTVISTIIGEYADPRLGTIDPRAGMFFDYSKQLIPKEDDFEAVESADREEIWIDYAADVGDGWNSTYAVAHSLAKHTLPAKFAETTEPTERGEILIFGGDGVYPTASSNEYEKRLLMPYRMAFRASEKETSKTDSVAVNLKQEPHVFSLPGNHDWYDSLVAFRKLFCSHIFNERKFASSEQKNEKGESIKRGGWRTRQKRSYFALKLPHKWWLLGVDLQLSHNIDLSQLEYFASVAKEMETGDRIILCVPEPYWVKAIKYQDYTDKFESKEDSVEKLEKFFADRGVEVKVYIAGDLHHYRRFESKDDKRTQKITAGGGGAFLHPTHDYKFKKFERYEEKKTTNEYDKKLEERQKFSLEKSYPEPAVSSRQDWKNLRFTLNNPYFGFITAVVYAILAWLLFEKFEYNFSSDAVWTNINSLINAPIAILVIAFLLLGVGFFTDSNNKVYKWVGGASHGIAHLIAIIFLGWLGYYLGYLLTGETKEVNDEDKLKWFVCVISVALLGGYIIGSLIMGIYLFVSLHFFGRHDNEAFSALKIEDYKNFLRLHIDKDKNLTIYSMKIERVPREWNPFPKGKDEIEYYTPESAIEVELIENPIVIKPRPESNKEENQNA